MKPNQIREKVIFLQARIEDAKVNGTSYFYSYETFKKEVKEVRSLRSQYKTITGDWLVIG